MLSQCACGKRATVISERPEDTLCWECQGRRCEDRRSAVLRGEVTWGPWKFEPSDPPSLVYQPTGYWLDVGRFRTSGNVLDAIAQLSGKTWMTEEQLGHLVRALDEILKLQQNYCGGGSVRKVSPASVLKQGFF